MKRLWHRAKRIYWRHRHKERERRRLTPYDCPGGRSAIPCYITACESKDSYTAKNPSSTAGGRYQILDSTWYAYGGRHYADSHPAAVAPPAEQDRIASQLWDGGAGAGNWACA